MNIAIHHHSLPKDRIMIHFIKGLGFLLTDVQTREIAQIGVADAAGTIVERGGQ